MNNGRTGFARLTQRALRAGGKNRALAIILLVSALAAGTLMATAPRPEPPTIEEKAWPVTAVAPRATTLSPELELFGRVESPHHSVLSAAIAAEVERVHVREGQRVREGDLLVSLDPREEQLRLSRAEAELADAEARLAGMETDFAAERQVLAHMRELYELTSAKAERLRSLNKRQLIATEQMENTLQDVARQGIELARQQALVDKHPQRLASARSAVERARSDLESRSLDLAHTEVRAPFAGRISRLVAAPGDRVAPGSELVAIYDTGALQVRAALPSSQLAPLKRALAEGREVAARTDDGAPLVLTELAGAVERGLSGVDGLFALPAGGAGLELGRTVALRLRLPPVDNLVALPIQSLYNNDRVYIIEQQRLRSVAVQPVGQRVGADGELEVLVSAEPLPPGVSILASSLPRAATGLRVRTVAPAVAGAGGGGKDGATSRQPG